MKMKKYGKNYFWLWEKGIHWVDGQDLNNMWKPRDSN